MYFPILTRREKYKTKTNGEPYLNYQAYFDEVAEDCKHRCVYCDVLVEEIGGEGMHLDHFKPRKHFPELELAPNNLVLACAKCNLLKSHWWPEKTCAVKSKFHGFIDPFSPHRVTFFEVNKNGEVVGKLPPSEYVIELLSLNRITRTALRKKRAIRFRAHELLDRITSELQSLAETPGPVEKERLANLASALRDVKLLLLI